MKALIKVGYGCNDHCAFCHTLDMRHVDGEAAEVVAKIHRAKALGHSMVVLSGGEPTIRPELVAWAKLSASLGMDFGLVTNGRMLAYAELTDALFAQRLKYVYLSLHGGTAKVHDLMVRSKAFDETYGALANLSGRGLDLHVNCVITKNNVEHLRGVVDAVRPYTDATLKFSMVEPKGGGDKLFTQLMPRVAQVAERVREAIDYGVSLGMDIRHGALPLCLMEGYEHRYDDLKTHRFRTMSEIGEPDFFPVDDLNKVQPEPCEGCTLRGPCPGLYRGYHEEFGHDELSARQDSPRSNSFDYVFERLIPSGKSCPLKAELGVRPWERGRDLFVRHGARLALFRAESRDFSDAEIAEIKHVSGQVYYDVSKKDAPDDFATDLVKLERSAECDECEFKRDCTGLFEPTLEPVFVRDDARLRELLAAIEGDVLDIGCGEGPYASVFAEGVASGRVRYTGVDPDPARVAALAREWPWAKVLVARGEKLPQGGEYDAVLMLRSWNHFQRPSAALAEARALLRPGGQLIVVDNVAFGLARMPRHSERAQHSAAFFEHYRNDDGRAAVQLLEQAGFCVSDHWQVAAETSNQWVVRATPLP